MSSFRGTSRPLFGLPPFVAMAYSAIFALAFAVYVVAWPAAPILDGDSAQYLEVAQDLADGSLDRLHIRTPGYPILLVATGSLDAPTRALFYVSLLLHFASTWILGAALHRAGAGATWLIGFACLLVLPLYAEPAAYVMTENLAQFVLVAGLAALVLWHGTGATTWLVIAAILFSCSALVRPVYHFLLPALGMMLVLFGVGLRQTGGRSRYLRAALVLMIFWVSSAGATAMYYHVRFGWFGLSPAAGFHFSTKTMGFVERLPAEYSTVREILVRERDAQLIQRGGTHTGTQAIWGVREELATATGLAQPELSNFLVRMNLDLIRRAPIEYLQEVARSLAVFWFPATGRVAAMNSAVLRWSWVAIHSAIVGSFAVQLTVLVGLGAIAVTLRRSVPGVLRRLAVTEYQVFVFAAAVTIIFYTYALSCIIDIGEPRQRRAIDVLVVFATFLGAFVWRKTAATLSMQRRVRRRAAPTRPYAYYPVVDDEVQLE